MLSFLLTPLSGLSGVHQRDNRLHVAKTGPGHPGVDPTTGRTPEFSAGCIKHDRLHRHRQVDHYNLPSVPARLAADTVTDKYSVTGVSQSPRHEAASGDYQDLLDNSAVSPVRRSHLSHLGQGPVTRS